MFTHFVKLFIAALLGYLYITWLNELFVTNLVDSITNFLFNPVLFLASSFAFMGSFFFYTDLLQKWMISFVKGREYRDLRLYSFIVCYGATIYLLSQISFGYTFFLFCTSFLISFISSVRIIQGGRI
ncbi:hypothetical protein WAK64_08835 [Bacillus spongiae]|uniref:Uncharacterized protein n=1 Tax=Bacillus spongiae TaxID=2683610 RepID=A0ABU8HD13_9BACI